VRPRIVAPGDAAGRLEFHRYIDGHWAILFSHPKDFTPVCTTELGAVARPAEGPMALAFRLARAKKQPAE